MNGNNALMELLKLLGKLEIPHMLVGSYSSNFYGVPRSTKDADLVIEATSRTTGFLEA